MILIVSQTAKGAKIFSAAIAATGDGMGKEGEEKIKLHTHSYCCLDYSQVLFIKLDFSNLSAKIGWEKEQMFIFPARWLNLFPLREFCFQSSFAIA